MSIQEAKSFIIHMRTLPSQIDYVNRELKRKIEVAEEVINESQESVELWNEIDEKVDDYYNKAITPDGKSASDLDDMF